MLSWFVHSRRLGRRTIAESVNRKRVVVVPVPGHRHGRHCVIWDLTQVVSCDCVRSDTAGQARCCKKHDCCIVWADAHSYLH